MAELLRVDPEELELELPAIHEHFAKFGDRLPAELEQQLKRSSSSDSTPSRERRRAALAALVRFV